MSRRLTRRTWVMLGILLLAIPALMAVFVCVWDERKYYLTSLLLVGLMFVPFVLRFEGRRPQARELVLLSTMTALAVAGRAAFYWLPQCKPVCAIVILTAVAFTPEAGFVTGAAAGLISNFFFGQGPWTPWQMFSWGMIGLVTGLLYRIGVFGTVGQVQTDEHGKRKKPVRLCVFGFFCGIAYGWFMNLQYIIGYVDPINWKTIGLAYTQSLYFDISHGVCTALVLYLAAEPWTRKLMRIRRKFSLGEK